MARWLSLSVRIRGATYQLRPPNAKPAPCVTRHRHVGARCLKGGGAANKLTAAARAVSRWWWSTYALRKQALHWRKASLHERAAVVRPGRCGFPTPRQHRVSRYSSATGAHCLGEEAHHERLLSARAMLHSYGQLMSYRRALRRREVFLVRRVALMRRASCGLPMPSQQRFARCTPPLSVSGEEAQHESLLRSRGASRCFWSSRTIR